MNKKPITEQDSKYSHLEKMNTMDLLQNINKEDKLVAEAVEEVLPQINGLVDCVVDRLNAGGRILYVGAGTSGRLGVVDASECPPTFGVPHGLVIGLIAGGDGAIRKAVEFAEDDYEQGWKDLLKNKVNENDFVIGIAASGSTPYVVGALDLSRKNGVSTGCITCNPDSKLSEHADYPIEVIVGPEFVTGSSRMKAGTAQKMVLNMISTCAMIKTGRVRGNKMVDMQLSNNKLVKRGTLMIMEQTGVDEDTAQSLLEEKGSVRSAVDYILNSKK